MIEIVGIDADDTLWDEASSFAKAEAAFMQSIEAWTGLADARERLRSLHGEIISTHGYGVAGYRLALSEFCNSEVAEPHTDSAKGLASRLCDDIEHAYIEPLDGVEHALIALGNHTHVILITKGQEEVQIDKLARSGLASAFTDVIVVNEKCSRVFDYAFRRSKGRPHAAMIGNSLKSDVLPALEVGAFGLHVPFGTTSPLEVAPSPDGHPHFLQFKTIAEAANWIVGFSR